MLLDRNSRAQVEVKIGLFWGARNVAQQAQHKCKVPSSIPDTTHIFLKGLFFIILNNHFHWRWVICKWDAIVLLIRSTKIRKIVSVFNRATEKDTGRWNLNIYNIFRVIWNYLLNSKCTFPFYITHVYTHEIVNKYMFY